MDTKPLARAAPNFHWFSPLRFLALALLLTGALLLLSAAWPAGAQTITDYDTDDDGLIEIGSIAQLNAIRWDQNGDGNVSVGDAANYLAAFPNRDTSTTTPMGCPAGGTPTPCRGYELTAHLTFTSTGTNWTPVTSWDTTFNGQGHTITGMNVNRASGNGGLFADVRSGGVIRDVGMINPTVTTTALNNASGGLVGRLEGGAKIYASYVEGGNINQGGRDGYTGGLVGRSLGTITASYARTTVNVGTRTQQDGGGLVGVNWGGTIIASYAAGAVNTGPGLDANQLSFMRRGGLVGQSELRSATATDSYCDISVSGTTGCVGRNWDNSDITVASSTTAVLQAATGTSAAAYSGIYANWNIDVGEGDAGVDWPWDFGSSSQYPRLNTPAERAALVAAEAQRIADEAAAEAQRIADELAEAQRLQDEAQRLADEEAQRLADEEAARLAEELAEARRRQEEADRRAAAARRRASVRAAAPVTAAYNPQTDHPESYGNNRYGMAVECQGLIGASDAGAAVADGTVPAGTAADGAVITIDLGGYTRDWYLSMSLWNGEYYAGYESLGIDPPRYEQDGYLLRIWVTTNPAQTRFLLSSGTPRTNLVVGYANCASD